MKHEAYNRKEAKPSKEKHVNTLAQDEAEARKLGLSYGVYMGYVETGYLAEYKRQHAKKQQENGEHVNLIVSAIGSGTHTGKSSFQARRMA